MDDMDHIQETTVMAQERLFMQRLASAKLNAELTPPESREGAICGDDIPTARLRTLPTTRYCVDCAGDVERKLKAGFFSS